MTFNPDPLVNYLRAQILRCNEMLADESRESKNGAQFSKGFWSGRKNECVELFRELVKLGVTFEPDVSLIIEAENLIPKGAFWCSHELNRALHHYRASFKEKNYEQAVLNEITIRQAIVKARLEAAKGFK